MSLNSRNGMLTREQILRHELSSVAIGLFAAIDILDTSHDNVPASLRLLKATQDRLNKILSALEQGQN